MHIAEEELGEVGLGVIHVRTLVWTKSGRCPQVCERWWKDAEGCPPAGRPGRQSAATTLRCFQVRAPDTTLPPPSVADFSRDIDDRVVRVRAFCDINEVGEQFGPVQRRLYSFPASWGGLGMRSLYAVRNAAFVGAWLRCMAHVRSHHGGVIPDFDVGWETDTHARYSFHGEFRCALDALNGELGPGETAYDVLGFGVRDILRSERPKCQKTLSRAVLASDLSRWKASLDPASRAMMTLQTASGEQRRPLASEWLWTTPFNAR
eukprot:gene19542-biopygen36933